MTNKNSPQAPSRFSIECMLNNELPEQEQEELKRRLAKHPRAQAYYEKAVESALPFQKDFPTFAKLDKNYTAIKHPVNLNSIIADALDRFKRLGAMQLVPVSAVIALVILAGLLTYRYVPFQADMTLKGEDARFLLFLHGRQTLPSSLVLSKPGDSLQIAIQSVIPLYYAVLYQDDDGAVQKYLLSDGSSGLSPRGSPVGQVLPFSIVLDTGWTHEKLICLSSKQPFSDNEIQKWIKQYASDKSLPGVQTQIFRVVNTMAK